MDTLTCLPLACTASGSGHLFWFNKDGEILDPVRASHGLVNLDHVTHASEAGTGFKTLLFFHCIG